MSWAETTASEMSLRAELCALKDEYSGVAGDASALRKRCDVLQRENAELGERCAGGTAVCRFNFRAINLFVVSTNKFSRVFQFSVREVGGLSSSTTVFLGEYVWRYAADTGAKELGACDMIAPSSPPVGRALLSLTFTAVGVTL